MWREVGVGDGLDPAPRTVDLLVDVQAEAHPRARPGPDAAPSADSGHMATVPPCRMVHSGCPSSSGPPTMRVPRGAVNRTDQAL
ncbi:hypothetical protein SVIO_046280 [Streptomyces violaceusniger]|uniref:Uncharacterized protein n=1 Tax=Streptomyces violaceusniger TaxID=68280 RepID=A0A4D4KYI3_STRVO|nr:hypothetical protein SVIO_046280 [Streptomyces violaceusniger]